MPQLKYGVNHADVYPRELWYAVGVFDGLARDFLGKPIVITSLNDGRHGTNSRHYLGLALDVRTRNLTGGEATVLFEKAKQILDPQGYDTVLETDHIHCEFDPKADERFLRHTE